MEQSEQALLVSERLTEILLPNGGYVMSLVEVYMDESGTHDGAPSMCVGGYLFLRDGAISFSRELSAVLKRHDLPYFHMVDCAHGAGPFARIPRTERIAIETAVIALVRKWSGCGFSVGLSEADYRKTTIERKYGLTPYAYCWRYCLDLVRDSLDNEGFTGDVAYFMEGGHKDRSVVDGLFKAIWDYPDAVREYRYISHSFGTKEKYLPLQAADLIAWQTYTFIRRQFEGNAVWRADLQALIRPQDRFAHLTEDRLIDAEQRLDKTAAEIAKKKSTERRATFLPLVSK